MRTTRGLPDGLSTCCAATVRRLVMDLAVIGSKAWGLRGLLDVLAPSMKFF